MRKLLAIASILVIGVISIGGLTAAVTGLPAEGVDIQFDSFLSEAQEVPATGSLMEGRMRLKFDDSFSSAQFNLEVSNNTEDISAAHIHCGVAGANAPSFVTLFGGSFTSASGTLASGTITNADINTVPCPGINNIASLAAAMMDGGTYVNIHTVANPGGEIRAQLFGR